MPEPVRSEQRYLPGLDGLRALAVAAVVAYHLGYGWAQGGLLGVGVFFTLSGYLITDILVGQFAARGRIRLGEFWVRRARRLLPALFVMLAVTAVWVNMSARSFLPGFRGDVIASGLYVSNWWYIGQHASYYARFAPPAPLDHLWSLAVEEQFYLVWPWVALTLVWVLTRRARKARAGAPAAGAAGAGSGYLSRRARWWMAGVTLALAVASVAAMARFYQPGYDPTRVYEGTDTRAFGLLIGAALAMVWPTRRGAGTPAGEAEPWRGDLVSVSPAGTRRGRVTRWLADLGGAAGLVVIGLLVWRTNQYSAVMFHGGLVLLSVATALVLAAAVVPGSLLGRALGWLPLRWVGVRSYGIYLWHYPVILLTAAAGAAGAAGGPVSGPRAVTVVAVTVAAAALSWRFVEEPIRRGRGPAVRFRLSWRQARRLARSPLAVAGSCLVVAGGVTAGVTAASRLATGPAAAGGAGTSRAAAAGEPAQTASPYSAMLSQSGQAALGQLAAHAMRNGGSPVIAGAAGAVRTGGPAAARQAPAVAGPAALVPALPTPPPQTSCRSVVHIGDSTSEGLISPDYLPNPAQRIPAQYARVGATRSIMKIVGATSIVESLPGTQNAFEMASAEVHAGYHGCWVLALGTNDTADVYVGSNVGRVQRIERMMKLIGGQPVLWVAVKSLLSSGPYSEANMLAWDAALAQVAPHYPNMRIYNWPADVKRQWFINDGIHFTSAGYAARGRLIANALAAAFPAS